MPMVVISDSSPLIGLLHINQLHLLQQLFGQIIIPQEVFNEVKQGSEADATILVQSNWISINPTASVKAIKAIQDQHNLDLGESAVIALAKQLNAEVVVVDERRARKVCTAELPEANLIGLLGIILAAKKSGLVPAVMPLVLELVQTGFRLSNKTLQVIKEQARE